MLHVTIGVKQSLDFPYKIIFPFLIVNNIQAATVVNPGFSDHGCSLFNKMHNILINVKIKRILFLQIRYLVSND